MKTLIYAMFLMSLVAQAQENLPILGEYQLHQQLVGGCFRLSTKDTFYIRHLGSDQGYLIGSRGTRHQPFQYEDDIITSEFLRANKLGVHRSKPTERGFIYVTTLTPFNEGRGLHAAKVVTVADNSYRNVIVDATFEVDGEFLFANFRNTRGMSNEGAGKCILKKVQKQ